MIAAIVSGLYFLIGIFMGRYCYGRLRIMAIEDCEPGEDWTDDDDMSLVVPGGAIAGALFWPLALVGFAIFLNPPKAPREIEEERKALAAKVKKMEQELDRELGRK